jgi:glycyl-tRNA synthetase beta chain
MIDDLPVSSRLKFFLEERASGYLRDLSYTAQEASALFSIDMVPSVRLLPSQYFSRLDAIREAEMAFPDDFAALANADKRARNILIKSSGAISEVMNADANLMTEEAEKALLNKTRAIRAEVDRLVNAGLFKDALMLTVQISKPVTEFFNSVMVNAEDEGVRQNRFRLLHEVTGLTNRVVDLSKLAT